MATGPESAAAAGEDAATDRLARAIAERDEARAQQAAVAAILREMSRAPTGTQPVFAAVARAAVQLCDADVCIALRDGMRWRVVAHEGPIAMPVGHEEDLTPQTTTGRAILSGRTEQVADIAASDPARFAAAHRLSRDQAFRSVLAVPLLRDGAAIGVIGLRRAEPGAFGERLIALLESFADQAVIAIENTRLFEAAEARASDLRAALEQQTAMAEALSLINRSAFDLGAVLETLTRSATRLCAADSGVLWIADRADGALRVGSHVGYGPEFAAIIRDMRERPDAESPRIMSRVAAQRAPIVVGDVLADPRFMHYAGHRTGGYRSVIGVPLLRDGAVRGVFSLDAVAPDRFGPRDVERLRTFADQAVVALDKAGLFDEVQAKTRDLEDLLQQQTATSDVLKTISRSAFDLQAVFEALLGSACRLCEAEQGIIYLREGDLFVARTTWGTSEEFRRYIAETPQRAGTPTIAGRVAASGKVDHIPDKHLDPGYRPPPRATAMSDTRTLLGVPILRDGQVEGVFTLMRVPVKPFTDRQIALVQTFADQAMIAIENVRLVTELRDSLEQQTATADILRSISRSPTDVQPVLDAVVKAAVRFCGATDAVVGLREGDSFRFAAQEGPLRIMIGRVEPLNRETAIGRAIVDSATCHLVNIPALDPVEFAGAHKLASTFGFRTAVAVPMMREGAAIGALALRKPEALPFTPRQVALLESFAAQAVIAIENVRLFTELGARNRELSQSLEQQTASAEILRVISRSPTDVQPVFDAIARSALRLLRGWSIIVWRYDGHRLRPAAAAGGLPGSSEDAPRLVGALALDRTFVGEALRRAAPAQVVDVEAEDVEPALRDLARRRGWRANLAVPMLREGRPIGLVSLSRAEPGRFSDREIHLLQTFADQAVIAVENARLFTELRESLDYQTATGEVLEVISRSAADVQPVLEAMLASAARLCACRGGGVAVRHGDMLHYVATLGMADDGARIVRGRPFAIDRTTAAGRAALAAEPVWIPDAAADPALAAREAAGSLFAVPLLRDGAVVGVITLGRADAAAFTDRQVALVRTFADQAVIAMENARLLSELTRREAELRVTFDHMGDGVAMFDADLTLAAWNRNFQELLEIPDAFLATRPGFADYVRLLVDRGELGDGNAEEEILRHGERVRRAWSLERTRPNGRVIELRNNPVPGGGAVLIYSDITERKRAEAEVRAARDAAEAALDKLKAAQANLIQAEKMASLGQLTAGIAHEIKNPLNFVNNFAALSIELLDEVKQIAGPALAGLADGARAEIDETMGLLTGNLGKIVEHGRRADGIVRSMLSHSRGGAGDWTPSNLDALVEEALNLAFHGARAQDKEFAVALDRDLAAADRPVDVVPQDVMRVFLNLFGNAFYAVDRRRRAGEPGFRPALAVSTRDLGDAVEVRVRDNGTGIPPEIRDKLFQPFFTTKPTGEGTGLGLSISYDIVTQQHGGTIAVESEPGRFTEFTVRLPRVRRTAQAGERR